MKIEWVLKKSYNKWKIGLCKMKENLFIDRKIKKKKK